MGYPPEQILTSHAWDFRVITVILKKRNFKYYFVQNFQTVTMTTNGDVKRSDEEPCGSCQPDHVIELRLPASDFSHSAGISFDIGMSSMNLSLTATDIIMQSFTSLELNMKLVELSYRSELAVIKYKYLYTRHEMHFVSVYLSNSNIVHPFLSYMPVHFTSVEDQRPSADVAVNVRHRYL